MEKHHIRHMDRRHLPQLSLYNTKNSIVAYTNISYNNSLYKCSFHVGCTANGCSRFQLIRKPVRRRYITLLLFIVSAETCEQKLPESLLL